MRNLIKISQDCGLHYRNSTSVGTVTNSAVSSDTSFKISPIKPDDDDDDFRMGLDIPPDDIDDIFWVTDDVSDWFLDKADVSGYFDEFDDKGNLINVQVPQETAARVKGDIDTTVKNEAPTLKPAVQKLRKLDDQQVIRRNNKTEETNKIVKSVVLPLDKATIERKLTDTKRKIHQAYEDKAKKQRKVKVIEFIPPPSKPLLHPHPKKARTCRHYKKDCLSKPKKDYLSMKKKDSLSRPKRKNYKLMSEMVLAG